MFYKKKFIKKIIIGFIFSSVCFVGSAETLNNRDSLLSKLNNLSACEYQVIQSVKDKKNKLLIEGTAYIAFNKNSRKYIEETVKNHSLIIIKDDNGWIYNNLSNQIFPIDNEVSEQNIINISPVAGWVIYGDDFIRKYKIDYNKNKNTYRLIKNNDIEAKIIFNKNNDLQGFSVFKKDKINIKVIVKKSHLYNFDISKNNVFNV